MKYDPLLNIGYIGGISTKVNNNGGKDHKDGKFACDVVI